MKFDRVVLYKGQAVFAFEKNCDFQSFSEKNTEKFHQLTQKQATKIIGEKTPDKHLVVEQTGGQIFMWDVISKQRARIAKLRNEAKQF